jgi:hypothetical protein
MSTDQPGIKTEPRRPWYLARLPRPVGRVLYGGLFLILAVVLCRAIYEWWVLADLRAAGAEVLNGMKGGCFITLPEGKRASLVLNPKLTRLNSLGEWITLVMDGTDARDEDMIYLERLEELVGLQLANTNITDAGIPHLARSSRLWRLNLNGTKVTDNGLAYLEGLKNLSELDLGNTNVTDAGTTHLAKLHDLRELSLRGTKVTDKGLADIQVLADLYDLDLANTDVTDAGVPHLKRLCPGKLNLKGTKITDDGVKALKQSLPNCAIER